MHIGEPELQILNVADEGIPMIDYNPNPPLPIGKFKKFSKFSLSVKFKSLNSTAL